MVGEIREQRLVSTSLALRVMPQQYALGIHQASEVLNTPSSLYCQ